MRGHDEKCDEYSGKNNEINQAAPEPSKLVQHMCHPSWHASVPKHASDQYPSMPMNIVQRLLLPACKTVRPSAARAFTGESQLLHQFFTLAVICMYACATYLC